MLSMVEYRWKNVISGDVGCWSMSTALVEVGMRNHERLFAKGVK
jgi:hypothetical protein